MCDNEWKRYLIMNTVNSPSIVQGKIEKVVSEKKLINLSDIQVDDDYKIPTFEELMGGDFNGR